MKIKVLITILLSVSLLRGKTQNLFLNNSDYQGTTEVRFNNVNAKAILPFANLKVRWAKWAAENQINIQGEKINWFSINLYDFDRFGNGNKKRRKTSDELNWNPYDKNEDPYKTVLEEGKTKKGKITGKGTIACKVDFDGEIGFILINSEFNEGIPVGLIEILSPVFSEGIFEMNRNYIESKLNYVDNHFIDGSIVQMGKYKNITYKLSNINSTISINKEKEELTEKGIENQKQNELISKYEAESKKSEELEKVREKERQEFINWLESTKFNIKRKVRLYKVDYKCDYCGQICHTYLDDSYYFSLNGEDRLYYYSVFKQIDSFNLNSINDKITFLNRIKKAKEYINNNDEFAKYIMNKIKFNGGHFKLRQQDDCFDSKCLYSKNDSHERTKISVKLIEQTTDVLSLNMSQ